MFLHKHNKTLYYTVPLLAILTLAFTTGFFSIDRTVINKAQLWDMAGRPYETFLYEQNLPSSLGAVFIAGTPDNLEKTEKYYKKVDIGDIFTSQLRSLLFGTKITAVSIAFYINFVFGISAVLFSLLVGYLIFKNGYISILVFLLFMIFRNSCQGLIYGLPLRHTYAVFNPLLASCIVVFIVMFLKSRSRRYWAIFVLSGFIVAYITYCRTSEGHIIRASLILFAVVMSLESLRTRREDLRPILISISIIFAAMYAGYFGYYKMITAFEKHRDEKFNFPPTKEKVLSADPPFHSLFVGLFRYPNEFGYSFHDLTGFNAVYERYPELKEKFSADINYVELANSEEYNKAIKELYLEFVFNNPKYFLTYLVRSTYDYFLFLPYYSWTGNKSTHAYIPIINDSEEIRGKDLALDFKNTPIRMLINLRLKYMPREPFFWIYFVCAYLILIEAIYTSFIKSRKTASGATSISEAIEANLPIYLLRGMLIYFFLASIVRILIPVHGQGVVVAFNMVVIYNLVRVVVPMGIVETRDIKIPAIKIQAKIQAWLLLVIMLSLYSICVEGWDFLRRPAPLNGKFKRNTTGWNAYKSTLASVGGGQSGNCLQITTTGNGGYAYAAVPTEVDEMYEVSAYFKRGTAVNGQIKVGTKIEAYDLYYSGILSDANWTQYRGIFKATATKTYITLVNPTDTSGLSCFFDSVTLTQAEIDETVR